MNYLITIPHEVPFTTNHFCENFFIEGMIIYDLVYFKFSTDGKTWQSILEDIL